MRRKFLSVVLCVCMMLTMAPFAFAAENSETPTGAAQGQESSSGSGGSSSNSLPEADSNGIITLTESVSIPAGPTTTAEIEGNLWTNLLKNDTTIDLNGKTLTLTTGGTIIVPEGKSFTIKNGTIQANNYGNGTISVFSASKDSKIIFDNITMVTNGAAIFPAGNATSATITNSNITAGTYAVGTNAQTKNGDLVYSYNINVTIENSTLSTTGYNNNDGDTCTVMINVPGTLNIENSTIIGSRQAVVARGGVTSIADSTITLTSPYNGSDKNNYDTTTWGSGNNLPMAALVVGNHADAYKYPATCTLSNTTVTAPDGYKTVYTYGMESAEEIARTVTFSADSQSNVGTIVADGIANVKAFSAEDGQLYTFADAMAQNKSNLTLIHNLSIPKPLLVTSNVDLDLGGNTLVGNKQIAFIVAGHGNATLRNGTVTSIGLAENSYVIDVDCTITSDAGDATFTLEKDAVVEAPDSYGIAAYGNPSGNNTATVNIKGTVNAHSSAFTGNGTWSGTVTTISDGATLTSTNGVAIYHPQNGTLTIKDATITGLGGIESKSGKSTVTVEDAYITATGSVKHVPNDNGNSSEGYAVAAVENSNYQGSPKFIIKNGHFTGPIEVLNDNQVSTDKTGSISISGGYFTVAPSAAYLDTDKVVIPSTEPGYAFTVGKKANTEVKPATAAPDVKVPDSMTQEEKTAATTIGQSVQDTTGVLSAAANEAASEISDAQVAQAKEQLKSAVSSVGDQTPVYTYAQTYLKVTPTAVEKGTDGSITSITLDIQPMYRVVASTESADQNFKFTGDSKNAIVLTGSEKPLTNIQTMEISLELPVGFATAEGTGYKPVYVQHKGHEYTATVNKDSSNKLIATFTNPDGFSPFTISKTSVAVATIGQNSYTSLQDAVDAVQNGETINVTGTDLSATVSGNKSFTVTGKSVTLTAASGYNLTKNNNVYTVSRQHSGSSSSTPTTYAVNVNAATNGAVAADKKTASKGTTVTVTASPSKGYVVDAVKVVDKDGKDVAVTEKDGKYVFTMPASAVTVTGSFKAETPAPVALPFTDVKSGNWFYDAVKYAYEQGLMTGTSATTFAPNGTMNRAMIVTVLYRLEKSPAVTGASKFTDVPAGQWYSDAVAWAAANKIVNGYDETTFGPMNAVTREQMAAILFRYEQVKGLENVTLEENLNRFPDQNKISAYAIPALQWAVGQKIINGNADGTLDPTGTATRAQVAQIFTNLLNK